MDAFLTWIAKLPLNSLIDFAAFVMSAMAIFWTFWDKAQEKKQSGKMMELDERRTRLDEKRTSVDIVQQQTETQLRITDAQLQQASALATAYREHMGECTARQEKIGELFDEIECMVETGYDPVSCKNMVKRIRQMRRELGL